MSVCSTRSLVGDTEDERWRSGDISMHAGSSRHGSTAPEDTQADDHTSASYLAPNPNALEPAYYGSKQDEEELNDLVRELIDMGDASWAHLGEKKLRQRQAWVPSLLHTLLKIIGRATGVEINIDSVWHDGRGMKACSASTERISAFTHSEDARKARSNFIRFVCESLGPRVCTAVADAHPTVYGDPKRPMRPVLPPRSDNWVVERQILILFFEYLWLWQGGHLPVPWQRLELDGLSRKFFLIEQRRLPSGVDCLRNPDNWDQDETDAWATALRDPSTPSHSRFQFRQPRPGMVEHETRTTIHPDSHLVYQPESLLYVRRMAMEKASYERKWQGLPPIPTEPYKPLTERQLAEAKAAVAGYKPLADLLNYLADYETYGPHQATSGDWAKAVKDCGHINSKLPSPMAGMEHLVRGAHENYGPQLAPEFFDFTDGMYNQWKLDTCLDLVDNNAFCHAHTETYMGGPYGFKWLVLLLVHLYSCGIKIRDGRGPAYDSVHVEWPSTNTAEIEEAVQRAQEKLEQSVKKLHEANKQRAQELASVGEAQPGFGEWSEEDVIECAVDAELDEWTRRNLIVTNGTERQRTGPKAPQSIDSSRKRQLTPEEDDEDILLDDDSEPPSPREVSRKKFKAT
ncbi:hypothetical protein FS749_001814 [Ceratobasidium sp. UAMH 11750]|nr:hypothetical protein FS749_001814 [Ceratobasidium sp. UAMH 11750]